MYTKFYKAYSSQCESHNAIVGAGQGSQEVQSNQKSMEDLIQVNTEAKDCIKELTQRIDNLEGCSVPVFFAIFSAINRYL